MRTAELRRTTLLQLLDALNDLGRSVWRVFILRGEALQRTGSWEAFSSRHPDVEAVSAAVNPVLIQSVAIKDEPLWRKIHSMTERA
jgi:hypothetical protein